jgi:hypothetical protein
VLQDRECIRLRGRGANHILGFLLRNVFDSRIEDRLYKAPNPNPPPPLGPLIVGLFLSVEREKGSHVGAFHNCVICYFDIGSPSAGLIVLSELCSIASIE